MAACSESHNSYSGIMNFSCEPLCCFLTATSLGCILRSLLLTVFAPFPSKELQFACHSFHTAACTALGSLTHDVFSPFYYYLLPTSPNISKHSLHKKLLKKGTITSKLLVTNVTIVMTSFTDGADTPNILIRLHVMASQVNNTLQPAE